MIIKASIIVTRARFTMSTGDPGSEASPPRSPAGRCRVGAGWGGEAGAPDV